MCVIFYFADDLILISETSTGLQKLINGLENYCFQWQVLVNLTKTKISVFNAQYVDPNGIDTFYFNKNEITKTNVYEYVGLMFSTNSPKISGKLLKCAMQMITSSLHGQKMFHTQIRPILEFGCEIWYS